MDNTDSENTRTSSLRFDTLSTVANEPATHSMQRVVLLDWIAGRGVAQDNNYLYVSDALDNSIKRFEKVKTRDSGAVAQLTSQRRLTYLPESVGNVCLVCDGSLLAVTCGKHTVCILEPGRKQPLQTAILAYSDVIRPGDKDKQRIATFSSICECSHGEVLVSFYGSKFVSELRLVSKDPVRYEAASEYSLSAPLRNFSYSTRLDRLAVSLEVNELWIVDRQFKPLLQLLEPTGTTDWQPWLCLLTDTGVCLVNDLKGIASILVYNAMNGTFLFKLVEEVLVYGWSFRPIKRRRGSRVQVDLPINANSELILYNSQVKSLERFMFQLPVIVPS